MNESLERIDPEKVASNEITGDNTLQLHLERYHYAGKFILPGTLVDIACGVGYGSYVLAKEYGFHITRIVAVDNDFESIQIARQKYSHEKITFVQADALDFTPPFPLNNIVCLETLEHLSDPIFFIKNISKQLATRGLFIASVPITPSMDANPYHLHDFTAGSFKKLFRTVGFEVKDSYIQRQPFNPFMIMKESRSKHLRKNIIQYYFNHPLKLYLRIRSTLFNGFSNKYLVVVFEKL